MKHVEIYTDGACSGNPGPGGYGAILRYKGKERELVGGRRRTTNNRMELMAAIVALETLTEVCKVTLYSDSSYVVQGIEKGWAKSWRAKGWKKANGDAAINPDLWQRLLAACEKHDVSFVWVKGHASNEYNNRCDALAVLAAKGDLEVDEQYEAINGA